MTNVSNTNMNERYWMLGYDLPAETRTNCGLTDADKTFLNSMRKDVWIRLREYGCVPVQQSLWNIRDPTKNVKAADGSIVPVLDAVKAAIQAWRAEYAAKGFNDINFDVWPMATNHVGAGYIQNSQMRFVFEAMLRAEKAVDEGIKAKVFRTRRYNELDTRCEDMRSMFIEDFSARHARWNEFEQIYMRVKRKMEDQLIKVTR